MAAVRYLVDDVDRAVAFYTTKLEFTLAERWGKAFAMVSRGDVTLWLSGPESSAARPMPELKTNLQPAPPRSLGLDRNFLMLCATAALWNFSLNTAGPFFNIYLVRNLKATALMVGLLSVVSSLASLQVRCGMHLHSISPPLTR